MKQPRMLSRVATGLALAVLAASAPAQERPRYLDPALPVDQRVADLLGRRTLEEKVAQTWTLWQGQGRIPDEAGSSATGSARSHGR